MTTCWVLTREINEYNQDGEYFEAVFASKPTHEQLTKVMLDKGWDDPSLVEHLLVNGGDRRGREETWYILREEELL